MGTKIQTMELRRGGRYGLGELGVSVNAAQVADVQNTAKQIEEGAGLLEDVISGVKSAWGAVSSLFTSGQSAEDKQRIASKDAKLRAQDGYLQRLLMAAEQSPCTKAAVPFISLAKATLYLNGAQSALYLQNALSIFEQCAAVARKAADAAAAEQKRAQDAANEANPVSGAMGWDCNAVRTNFKDGTWTITRSDTGAVIERGSGSARPSTPAGSYDEDGKMVCSGKGVGGTRSAGGLPGPGSVPGKEDFYTPPVNPPRRDDPPPPAPGPGGKSILGYALLAALGVGAVVVGSGSGSKKKSGKKKSR